MENKIIISFNWWNNENTEIPTNHQTALEESAKERIFQMMNEGYTSGELHDNIRISDDGEDGIEYHGWFEITTETV